MEFPQPVMPPCRYFGGLPVRNVLITSAGRRVELLNAFLEAASDLGRKSAVFAADLNPSLSSVCQVVDRFFALPRVTEPDYPEALLACCLENDIGLVVPTIDTELAVLADQRSRFAEYGIHLVVSDSELVSLCRDKRLTGNLFQKYGISYPRIYPVSAVDFPCFVKPYNGSSSIGAKVLKQASELSDLMRSDSSLMFMELIDSRYVEYTVDAYYDKSENLRCLVPRKRIETRAGEVSKGVTRRNFVHARLSDALHSVSGARGCLTIQVFVDEANEDIIGLEINPRFGGGYPLSQSAGARFPLWLMQEYLLGIPPEFSDEWESDLLMLRYDAKVLVHGHL